MDTTQSNLNKTSSDTSTTFPRMWDMIVVALLFFVGQAAVSFLAVHAGIIDATILPDPAEVEEYMDACVAKGNSTAIVYPISMITVIILTIAYMRLRGYRNIRAQWSSKGLDPSFTVKGFVWILAVQIVIEPIAELLPEFDVDPGRGGWACLTAVVMAPIFEEYLFRGLMVDALKTRYRALPAVLISALMFGVMHVSPSTAFSAFVVGVILAIIYLRTKSLVSTIILHSINNAVAFALLSLNLKDLTYRELTGGGMAYYLTYAVAVAVTVSMFMYAWNTVLKRE